MTAAAEHDARAILLESLNAAQREAVAAPSGHRLVLAGAGSGKTRVLVHRAAWLMAVEGVSPHSILAVTFTNKAAVEMRGRLERFLSIPVRPLWVGTFHGIAHRMLRLHWKDASLPQNFQILDADDQLRLVRRTQRALDLPEEHWPTRALVAFINAEKEAQRRPGAGGGDGDHNHLQMQRVYRAYQEACTQSGLVDFTELLLRAYELCRDHAGVQDHYRRRFSHLLVDEFQDTNDLQYRWLRVLAGERGQVFCVGDDDQSIYSWRGARVQNMLDLSGDFPGAEITRLEQNYRSSGTILDAANALIAHNTGRLGKTLWTDAGAGEAIQLYSAYSDLDEADFVLHRIRQHAAEDRAHAEMAVLYRTSAQSRLFEERLIHEGIPYRIWGGLRFFDRAEVKDALAYLRLTDHRHDDAAFERVVNLPTRGIGATTLERLRAHARRSGQSLWDGAASAGAALGRSAGALAKFRALIDGIARDVADRPLSDATATVIERSGLKAHHGKERGEQAAARLENLDELVNAARLFEEPEDEELPPLTAFLTHAALEAGERQAGAGEDAVQLMTLHSAKGLEFPVVFLVGLEQGLFPHRRALDEGGLEEERRLCYVGMTRARQLLYLSAAEVRRVHGGEQAGAPSQFLSEMPPECLIETRPRIRVTRPVALPRARPVRVRRPIAGAEGMAGYALGQRVMHQKFGEGTVLSFDGDGERTRVEVRFNHAGTKWLMLSFANLQPLESARNAE